MYTTQTIYGTDQIIGLPLTYAFQNSKKGLTYTKIYQVLLSGSLIFGIHIAKLQFVVTDFEVSITNATNKTIGYKIHICLFHLCQSLYYRI